MAEKVTDVVRFEFILSDGSAVFHHHGRPDGRWRNIGTAY